ncbi:hypothetical protein P6709_10320 [Jeotgalibacillus sp. ET6]|uniref:hypothetical protein n=1 Tax=Jeotgalibacillus sp. ET6 TaxID=3037260 RepID=UPI00241890DC|nr:hypothetical protein [Jeotgalibacillus sp. ET6]MDG5472146.1 hypothetical protein [Jeotgalibacillus sp. ET6]
MSSEPDWFVTILPLLFAGFWIFVTLIPFALLIFIIVYAVRVIKRMEQRAEEKLSIQRESLQLQREQMESSKQSNSAAFTPPEEPL